MTVLFISDLHLDAARPQVTRAFLDFLAEHRTSTNPLYILGDLFDVWLGDDDPDPRKAKVTAAMADFAAAGNDCFVMHGNRDFLIGEQFCSQTGFSLLADPALVELDGLPVLLMHGDTLCTGDHEYQDFRKMVRNPAWQTDFLAKSITERQAFAAQARNASRTESALKPESIMDVDQNEVDRVMEAHGVSHLVHGHTHRPQIHEWNSGNTRRFRYVLGDWHQQGSVLKVHDGNFDLQFFDL